MTGLTTQASPTGVTGRARKGSQPGKLVSGLTLLTLLFSCWGLGRSTGNNPFSAALSNLPHIPQGPTVSSGIASCFGLQAGVPPLVWKCGGKHHLSSSMRVRGDTTALTTLCEEIFLPTNHLHPFTSRQPPTSTALSDGQTVCLGAPLSNVDIDGPTSLECVGTCHLLVSARGPPLKHQDNERGLWLQPYTNGPSVKLLFYSLGSSVCPCHDYRVFTLKTLLLV